MKAVPLLKTVLCYGALLAFAGLILPRTAHAQIPPGFGIPGAGQFVRITSPPNHATFYTPVDIPVFAYAREEGLGIGDSVVYTNIEFYYSGTNSLGARLTNVLLGAGVGLDTTNPSVPPLPISPFSPRLEPRLAAVYSFVWTNAPAGSFTLTAVARGLEFFNLQGLVGSLSRTSAPVNLTITTSLTNSNPVNIASIVALDPIAIAGTNVWWRWPGLTNGTPTWTNWPPPHWGYTTNWGPKDGLFAFRRYGDVSTNLTINFNIGGTASNGVDYVALPGCVTIPAGEAYALLPVVPLDNNVTNLAKTVVLSLAPDTNTPPNYLVGIPPKAEVLILDYWPVVVPLLLADHTFHCHNTNAPDGAWFGVQFSTNMVNWTSLSTNQVVHGSIDFLDPDAPANAIRYYRTVPLMNKPAN